ncbi:MAG TPA: M28 family metallopeptidase [Bryobacteraceae bacterium]|nr:M28 family metallopeptidase [Bryobacteraceae bacterium]
MKKTVCALAAPFLLLTACSKPGPQDLTPALNSISADSLLSEIKVLASDDFEGRKPGSPGEVKTIAYMQQQFQQAGLRPGNPDGTWLQAVPLAGITSKVTPNITVGGKKFALEDKKNFIAFSERYEPAVSVPSTDIVFVGYGVVAPEYDWDDYKGLDVKGKTLLMLVNDPAVPDPEHPDQLDEKMFKGKAMTYYGRWTYKYEIAAAKGAAAAIIIHETGPAGYPFEVVTGSWGGENFGIQRPDNNRDKVAVESWMTYDKAAELCKLSGLNLAELKKAAIKKDFKPVVIERAKASFDVQQTLRKVDSHNVIGILEGSDPQLKKQYVIYTAHWDHLGKDPTLQGDQIYNGAADNASGSAGLIEIARAYKKLDPAPKRSIIFLSVTAEEQGLLGSEYYAENPLYPLRDTLADINMDELNMWGKTKDLTIIGLGNSSLDDVATEVLKSHGRTVSPDPEPEVGSFYRSDHFEFAKQGVPALDPDSGTDYIGKPAGYGKQKIDYYTAHDYHKPSDEVKPDWDLSGAVDDLRVYFEIGFRVAQADTFPEWNIGTEFKAKRDAMMK